MSHLLANLTQFARLLRAAGIPITPAQVADAAAGLAWIDLARREDVQNVCRALWVQHRRHLPLFDRAFDLFWRQQAGAGEQAEIPGPQWTSLRLMMAQEGALAGEGDPEKEPFSAYSAVERLRHKPFTALSAEEMTRVRNLIAGLNWQPPVRRTRRTIPARHGAHFDGRRTLRHSLRYGGEPLRLARRARTHTPRPLILLCDASGSMAPYSRMLLHFAYALSVRLAAVEVFLFSTRLTRVTPHLRRRSIHSALDQIAHHASDLGGGTQIGGALKAFNLRWARRLLHRGAILLLISDGWDRGDPAEISAQMARLHRLAHRLIWLNPHLAAPDYEPLTRGMRAALPHIDHFLPVHNLHSLEQLAALLETLPG
ncbi:MAG: VWA domain-containing protein [Caldilineales bacterium]|nr:VWA domain-containing protein [Caldilineales bacterium]